MFKKIIKIVITSLTVIFFLLALFILITGIRSYNDKKPTSIFGFYYSVVPTASMQPEINPGDFVISKDKGFDSVEIEQDVVYYSALHDMFIVHRVYGKNEDGSFIMKGINNSVVDEEYLTEENYVSTVLTVINFLNVGNFLLKNRGIVFLFIGLIFVSIIVNEVLKMIKAVKEDQLEKQKTDLKESLEKELILERERIKKELEEELKTNESAKLLKNDDAKL